MNETLLFAIFAEVVRSYPAAQEYPGGPDVICSRPNTFAVLTDLQDLNMENLGKSSPRYRELPFFFSRKWEREGLAPGALGFEYPILAVVPQRYEFAKNNSYATFEIDIAILDQNAYPKGCGSYCESRTYEEHMRDCRIILRNIIEQVRRYTIWHNDTTGENIARHDSDIFPDDEWEEKDKVASLLSAEFTAQYIRDVFLDNVSGLFGSIRVSIYDCAQAEDNWPIKREKFYSMNDCATC